MYEAVILDCGGVYGAWNMSLARLSDEVLLVTTNELASLHAAQRALMYMDNQRIDMKKVKVVVNRYQKESGLLSDHFKEAFANEVFQIVPADSDTVQKSLMDGKPIQGGSQIGKSLAAMADKLVERREKDPKKGERQEWLAIIVLSLIVKPSFRTYRLDPAKLSRQSRFRSCSAQSHRARRRRLEYCPAR